MVLSKILINTWQNHSLDVVILLLHKIARRWFLQLSLSDLASTSSTDPEHEDCRSHILTTSNQVLAEFFALPNDDLALRLCPVRSSEIMNMNMNIKDINEYFLYKLRYTFAVNF